MGRVSLWVVAILLLSMFVIPAARTGSLTDLVCGVVLAVPVAGLPFLFVLSMSSYRRLEVRRGSEIVCTVVYRITPSRVVRIPWEELDHVVCERVIGDSDSPDRLRLTAHWAKGKKRVLLGGSYSESLAAVLGRHFEGKFTTSERRRYW